MHNQPEHFECLEQASHYLNAIAKNHKIIYLSARDYRTKDLTMKQLEYFGFPKIEGVNELIVMPKELCPDKWTGKDLNDFHDISLTFKKDILNKLKLKNNVIVGIGDTISDLEACYNNDILSVIIQSSIVGVEEFVKEHSIDPYSYIILDTWEEIYNYVSAVSLENQELKEICIQHSNDYSKWMYDLDNKASLILVAATFCITSFISLLNSRSFETLSIKILILAGTVSSAFSMFFAVRAFASRNTHGRAELKDRNRKLLGFIPKIINECRNMFRIARGKTPLYSKAMGDVFQSNKNKDQVNQSSYARVAYLQYFKERYKNLNPDEIVSKTLFNLRDANYKKIAAERYARFFLNTTLVIIVIVSANYILGHTDVSGKSINGKEEVAHYISDAEKYETILQLDDTCFEENSLELSVKGKRLLQTACQNDENEYLLCNIVSNEEFVNETIKNHHDSIKYELVKEYIKDIQNEKEVILIVQ